MPDEQYDGVRRDGRGAHVERKEDAGDAVLAEAGEAGRERISLGKGSVTIEKEKIASFSIEAGRIFYPSKLTSPRS